ncbi:MAG: hypothetical protein PHE83_03060 [Opitutaceae bacterium]|nr:hypothetical protein [Opitutaceae bacterium]
MTVPPIVAATLPRHNLARGLALTALLAVTGTWLWVCWCVFPGSAWNDLRLAPAFALAQGEPLYPGKTASPINTWTYGPLPVISMLPATWATSPSQALLIAGGLNLITSLGAIFFVCTFWPTPRDRQLPWEGRLLVGAFTILLWPRATFQFLQADNLAVALGLVGTLLLVNAKSEVPRWGAALCTIATLACKQTSCGLVLAQFVWLWLAVGKGEAMRHGVRCLVSGAVTAGLIVAGFGLDRIWFNLVFLPSRFPWVPNPLPRIMPMAPELAMQVLIPGALLVIFRKAVWCRESPLLLPALAWLCTLPPGLAALLKLGGTINSIQSFQLWLTPTFLVMWAAMRIPRQTALIFAGSIVAALAIGGLRLSQKEAVQWYPAVEHYRQAAVLAQAFPEQIWFPCNPLITIFSDGRVYHDEDGLHMRQVSGMPPRLDYLNAYLPRHMCVIALPRNVYTWGIAEQLGPAQRKRDLFGSWVLYSWLPEVPVSPRQPIP